MGNLGMATRRALSLGGGGSVGLSRAHFRHCSCCSAQYRAQLGEAQGRTPLPVRLSAGLAAVAAASGGVCSGPVTSYTPRLVTAACLHRHSLNTRLTCAWLSCRAQGRLWHLCRPRRLPLLRDWQVSSLPGGPLPPWPGLSPRAGQLRAAKAWRAEHGPWGRQPPAQAR